MKVKIQEVETGKTYRYKDIVFTVFEKGRVTNYISYFKGKQINADLIFYQEYSYLEDFMELIN
jgi:hypothetical protein